MAQIPQTDIKLRANIRAEYGGSYQNVSMSEYYRFVDNSELVQDSVIVPYNPKAILENPYYPAIGASTNYARWQYEYRQQTPTGSGPWNLIPGTDIVRVWFWQGQIVGDRTDPISTAAVNFASPNAFYGDENNYFYFTPAANYPWPEQTFIEPEMFISNTFTTDEIFGVPVRQYTKKYSIWRTLGKSSYPEYYNQTVPQNRAVSGEQISMGDFRGQENPPTPE